MDKKNNYFYGFDIGCASVGWAVVDKDTYEIIDLGSNIFEEANPDNNKIRRDKRGQRRLLRRRKNRIRDFKVSIWNDFVEPKLNHDKHNEILTYLNEKFNKPIVNIVETKVKGLNEKISLNELYFILLNYCKHKGISYLDDALDEDNENETKGGKMSNYQKGILFNQEKLKEQLPCQIQMERIMKYGKYRGENDVNENNETIVASNVWTTKSYEKEIKNILDTQSKYYDFINNEFIEKFLGLFKRKREYYIGPGNEKSRTDYGIYTTKKNENGEFIQDDNIFSKLVGKCSVFNKFNGYENEEFRASASSYTAEYYNLLNDLNNIKINGEKIDNKNDLIKIINEIKSKEKLGNKNIEKIIKQVVGKNDGIISGARIDKKGENIYHQFECYRKLKKYLSDNNINIDNLFNLNDISNEDVKKYNKIMEILTINTERDGVYDALSNSNGLNKNDNIELDLDDNMIELLYQFRKSNRSLFSKWHSFSNKLLYELIPEMIETGDEQMTCIEKMGFRKNNKINLNENEILNKNIVTSEIYNPVVVRSTRVAINILNALISKYGYPKKVVVEMPRDKNEDEERKRITKLQKQNEDELNSILLSIKKDYGIDIEKDDKYFQSQKNLSLKLKLWNEQEKRCIYSNKPIDIDDLLKLKDYNKFEIDHIIPLSVSFDDSRNNKVLVYRSENQKKGQRTAASYIKSNDSQLNYEEYKKIIENIYNKTNKKKLSYLLNDEDITKKEVRDGFINRNLNDTQYASKVFLNSVQDYFNSKNTDTIVKVIRGQFTHQIRVGLNLPKNRDESFAHHAIDASIICYSQMGFDSFYDLQKPYIDEETGEILDRDKFLSKESDEIYKDVMYQKKWKQIKNNLENALTHVKYWHKVDSKPNRSISDETIYGTIKVDDNQIKVVKKFDLRSDKKGETFKNLVEHKNSKFLLVEKFDKKTFEYLTKIYEEYKDGKNNPFVLYEKQTGNKVRKYAKDGNGAIITKLKYVDGELNKCIDISHKFNLEKGSKKIVLLQLVPFRTDVYYNTATKKFKFVGVKQNMLTYKNNKNFIDVDSYNELLISNGILKDNNTIENLKESSWEYRLSFYDNDIIQYVDKDKEYKERHHSLNSDNVIETKPINAKKFIKNIIQNGTIEYKSQNLKSITNVSKVEKIIVHVLGDEVSINKETFTLEV